MPKGQITGDGSINDVAGYGFLLTAVDSEINGGGNVDTFRIKIWSTASDEIVYDNQIDLPDGAGATTAIAGGNIMIHAK